MKIRNLSLVRALICILVLTPLVSHASESTQGVQKLLMIYSYHFEWGWNQDSRSGLLDGLARGGFIEGKNLEVKDFFMDTKRTYTTVDQIQQRAQMAWRIIREFKPDLVYINDDNALRYVAVPFPDNSVRFVFAGVNVDPEKAYPGKIVSLEKPGHNITGILERFPYEHSFTLTKRILPERKKIVMLSDMSPSGKFVMQTFEQRYTDKVASPQLEVLANLQFKTYKEWQEAVQSYQDKADLFGIMTYHQLLDEKGKVVPSDEVAKWMIKNNKVPEIGFLMFHAEDFCLSVVGVSPYKSNRYLGKIAAQILENEQHPSQVPIIDPGKVDIAFNIKRASTLGITIPMDFLGIATELYQDFKWRW